jgi:hypothetical protein
VVTAAPQSDLFRLFFLKLKDSLAIVKTAVNSLEVLTGAKGLIFKDKINSVVAKNPGLAILQQVNGVLQGEIVDLPSNMSYGEAAELRYCPIVSVDVERSFSTYKYVFSDRRTSFTEVNLEKTLVINSFYARKEVK